MSRMLIIGAVVSWAAIGLVGESQVRAWSRFHPGWKLPVTYALSTPSNDLGEEKSEAIVAQAVADWMNVRCTSLRTEYLGRTDRSPGARDGANVFGWVHDDWTNGAGVIGTTSYRSTSQGSESDIAFNGQDYRWTTGPGRSRTVNAYSIVAHELGHFFGLGHSEERGTVMYASYGGGILSLAADDEKGICALYPGGKTDCRGVSCPLGFVCSSGRCEPAPETPPRPTARVCASCRTHADCGSAGDYCLRYPDERTYCGKSCATDEECGLYSRCVSVEGIGRQCVRYLDGAEACTSKPLPAPTEPNIDPEAEVPLPPEDVPPKSALGTPCETNQECAGGVCAERGGVTFCSATCESDVSCGEGFACEARGDEALCVPVTSEPECSGGSCAESSGRGCSAGGPLPSASGSFALFSFLAAWGLARSRRPLTRSRRFAWLADREARGARSWGRGGVRR